jgi:hypothetical protein
VLLSWPIALYNWLDSVIGGAAMATDPAQEYLRALNSLNEAKKELDELVSYLLEVGNALRKEPFTVHVSNVELRPVVPLARLTYVLNAIDWPTAQQIAERVIAVQNAYFRAEYLWFHLSPAQKAKLPRFKVI